MQAIDRLKSDLDDWVRRSGRAPGNREFDSLRDTFARSVPKVPGETMAALFTTFLSRYGSGGDESSAAAIDWLAGVGSLLLSDYDGTPFSAADWAEIRELLTQDAGDMDMDVLSYVMSQVMDHGGLSD